jgi:hypothetical protein
MIITTIRVVFLGLPGIMAPLASAQIGQIALQKEFDRAVNRWIVRRSKRRLRSNLITDESGKNRSRACRSAATKNRENGVRHIGPLPCQGRISVALLKPEPQSDPDIAPDREPSPSRKGGARRAECRTPDVPGSDRRRGIWKR